MAAFDQNQSPHRVVVQALEDGVGNRDWFLWVNVEGREAPTDLKPLVSKAEAWLAGLDPDASSDAVLDFVSSGLHVTLKAIPKKPHARGADPLVGNPFPAFAYWSHQVAAS